MKSLLFLLVLFITFQVYVISQNTAFEKGTIITKKNDTLKVFVELSVTYLDKVYYKTDVNSSEQNIKINKIKSLATPYNHFENIAVERNEYLFRSVVAGKYSLLQYVEVNNGPSHPSQRGTMTMYTAPTIIYAVKTNDGVYILKKKKDKELLFPLLNNCLEIKAKIEQKSFNLEDLEEVVKGMNKCRNE